MREFARSKTSLYYSENNLFIDDLNIYLFVLYLVYLVAYTLNPNSEFYISGFDL